MPYIDIHKLNYEETLYIYTNSLRNGRYDIYNSNSLGDVINTETNAIHSFNYGDPSIPVYYNTYNTYRSDINPENILVKQYETIFDEYRLDLNNNYYNITNSSINSIFNTLRFEGIAINYDYPCNGPVATLEDIFAEYAYDYIVATDLQRYANGLEYYYFENTEKLSKQFSYEIIPIGTEYIDEEGNVSIIEYDGTTIPSVELILSGELYIVIKSGNKPARKIYFNNEYIPTLFVNDDKYNEKLIPAYNITEDTYKYILNDNQPMRLCDISRITSMGCFVQFLPDFIYGFNEFLYDKLYIDKINRSEHNKIGGINISFTDTNNSEDLSGIIEFGFHIIASIYNSKKKISQLLIYNKDNDSAITYNTSYTRISPEITIGTSTGFDTNNTTTDISVNKYVPINRISSGITKPNSDIDYSSMDIIVIPVLHIKGYKTVENANVLRQGQTITVNKSENDYAVIYLDGRCNVDGYTNNVDNDSPLKIFEEKANELNKKISLPPNWDIDMKCNVSTGIPNKIKGGDMSITPTISIDACYISIQKIPYQEFYIYELNNVIKINSYDNSNTLIKLNNGNKEPAFFKKKQYAKEYVPIMVSN